MECFYCSKVFQPVRKSAKFCSTLCRVKASRGDVTLSPPAVTLTRESVTLTADSVTLSLKKPKDSVTKPKPEPREAPKTRGFATVTLSDEKQKRIDYYGCGCERAENKKLCKQHLRF